MSLTGEITEYFKEETEAYLIMLHLQDCGLRAQQLIQEWDLYSYNERNNPKKMIQSWINSKKRAKDVKQYQTQVIQQIFAQNRLEITRKQINYNNLIKESYKLLNEIGEIFTKEPIVYSITLPGEDGTKITFEMGIDAFLKYAGSIQKTRIDIHSAKTLLKNLESDEAQRDGVMKYDWSDSENEFYNLQNFNSFLYGIGIAWHGGVIIPFTNEGTQLESYLHYINSHNDFSLIEAAETNHLGGTNFNTMVYALNDARNKGHNSDPFWTGGDVNNRQIKGKGAQAASIATLKAQLLRFVTLMNTPDFSQLSNIVNQQADSINNYGNKVLTRALNTLGTIFMQGTGITTADLSNLGVNINDLI